MQQCYVVMEKVVLKFIHLRWFYFYRYGLVSVHTLNAFKYRCFIRFRSQSNPGDNKSSKKRTTCCRERRESTWLCHNYTVDHLIREKSSLRRLMLINEINLDPNYMYVWSLLKDEVVPLQRTLNNSTNQKAL